METELIELRAQISMTRLQVQIITTCFIHPIIVIILTERNSGRGETAIISRL